MKPLKRKFAGRLLLSAAAVMPLSALAFEPFVVEDIRVDGLQRIAVGTVYNYLGIKEGDRIDDEASAAAIKALFSTGFFDDVALDRDGDQLVVFVVERPAISSISIEGNDLIPSEQLTANLDTLGLSAGKVFNRSVLDKVVLELKRQYLMMGYYNVRMRTTVEPQDRNRVSIRIDIDEGEVATIKQVNIVGNRSYDDEVLLPLLELGVESPLSLFGDRDQYSRPRLSADIETLRDYYMDRGHLHYQQLSTQVSLSPDRRDVYITLNISEGDTYRIGGIDIQGNTIVDPDELMALAEIESGELFSRRKIVEATNAMREYLGDRGYAFANINPVPQVNEENKTVSFSFVVEPGQRVSVRRVNIVGNLSTNDEVFRRELRQMESGIISTRLVSRSRIRMQRLGYVQDVTVNTEPVPASPDQVDVEYRIKEAENFGSLNVGLGYGDGQGLLFNAGIQQDNFLGTGESFKLDFNNSSTNTVYSFSMTDPYYTMDGVSRTLRFDYRTTDPTEASLSEYTTDSYSAGISFNVPVSEYDTVRYSADYTHTDLHLLDSSSQRIVDFCAENASVDDCAFNTYKGGLSWVHDTRNRVVFPEEGIYRMVSAETSVPLDDESLSFYKLRYRETHFYPLWAGFIFKANGELGYADAYGDTTSVPPFERFYLGGMRSVRGYKPNSLGPRDELNNPLGGTARINSNFELIIPTSENSKGQSTRLSAFVDGGNVYDTGSDVDLNEMRWSAGVALIWNTAVGPLAFSYATPLNAQSGDETENFQFTLGMPF